MYPGFISRWKTEHCGESRVGSGCGGSEHRGWRRGFAYAASGEDDPRAGFGGGAFGVRRPLRYLAYKLQLEDSQIGELAKILDEIKTERAQAAVDDRRVLSALAEVMVGESFDEAKAAAAAALRVQSAERLRAAVVTALGRLHKLLEPEQRARLAYLIRTGTLTI